MKLGKEKKNELISINREFLSETLNGSALLHEALSTFVEDKLKTDSIEGVIQAERKCDEIKEKYVQVLFRDKRALPFLVEDRYNILMMIDTANDRMEFFARFLAVYPFKLYKEIKDEFSSLCSSCAQSVEELVNCATLIETDFDGAYKKTFEIEELQGQLSDMKKINQYLEKEAADLQSIQTIQEKYNLEEFVPTTDVSYIAQQDYAFFGTEDP